MVSEGPLNETVFPLSVQAFDDRFLALNHFSFAISCDSSIETKSNLPFGNPNLVFIDCVTHSHTSDFHFDMTMMYVAL